VHGLGGGWCNGAAGYVSLWTLADQLLGGDEFGRLALAAAWTAYEDDGDGLSLCCGLAGRAYALLNIYRHGGGDAWLARARNLADRAAACARHETAPRESLYNGELGVAVLAADLEDPAHSCMPLYESEGW
jgi:serine/threonine-protein kinase